MLELILKTPVEELIPKMIAFNNEELKRELTEGIEKYMNMTYTDEQIPLARGDRATLNKFLEAVEDERKRVKKAYLKPYEDFETKIKELTEIIRKPILLIDTKIKDFENGVKEEKKIAIEAFYEVEAEELATLIKFERIFKPEWLNLTYKMAHIMEELRTLISRARMDLKVLTDLKSPYEMHLKDFYLNCLDLTRTLAEKTRKEDTDKRINEVINRNEVKKPEEPKVELPQETKQEELVQVDFRVTATKTQLADLKQFMKEKNIKFGRVE